MNNLHLDKYLQQKSECDGLCDITDEVAENKNYLRCVTCPFCKQIVDAILTETTIACPSCEVIVDR